MEAPTLSVPMLVTLPLPLLVPAVLQGHDLRDLILQPPLCLDGATRLAFVQSEPCFLANPVAWRHIISVMWSVEGLRKDGGWHRGSYTIP